MVTELPRVIAFVSPPCKIDALIKQTYQYSSQPNINIIIVYSNIKLLDSILVGLILGGMYSVTEKLTVKLISRLRYCIIE